MVKVEVKKGKIKRQIKLKCKHCRHEFKIYSWRKSFPIVTVLLLIINISIFLSFGLELPLEIAKAYGIIPSGILQGGNLQNLFFHMFFHQNVLHLLFNMVALIGFGSFLEMRIGRTSFLALYLSSGIIGGLVHVFIYPASINPLIGASGAIFGVFGAIALLEPTIPTLLFGASYIIAAIFLMKIGVTFGMAHVAHLGGMFYGALISFLVDFKKALKGVGYFFLTFVTLIAIVYLVPNLFPVVTGFLRQTEISYDWDFSLIGANATHSTYSVNTTIENKGYSTAENLIIKLSFDNPQGGVWDQMINDPQNIGIGGVLTGQFIVKVQKNVTTRLHLKIYGDNFLTQESYSNWYQVY